MLYYCKHIGVYYCVACVRAMKRVLLFKRLFTEDGGGMGCVSHKRSRLP